MSLWDQVCAMPTGDWVWFGVGGVVAFAIGWVLASTPTRDR